MTIIVRPFGETVTLHVRTVTGSDGDGNDVFGVTDTTLQNIPVWSRTSTEQTQGQDTVIVGKAALLPPGTNAAAIDSVTLANGKVYEVDGEPGEDTNPFTGTNPGVLVNLKLVTG